MNKNIIMKNNGMTIIELIICIVIMFIIAVVSPPIVLKYTKEKSQKNAINEYKVEQYDESLSGMNYNNGKGQYKDCKIKIFYNTDEREMNNFISNKDIVDIKTSAYRVLIIYIDKRK